MKRLFNIIVSIAVVAGFVSCDQKYTLYGGPEYIMFADTISTNMVTADGAPFKVKVASSVVRNYDRTLAVEIIDKGSKAIENFHYRLGSNTITIPAGKTYADVDVYGIYDNIEPTDSLGFTLQLVMRDELNWEHYPEYNRTKVVMYKSCPFDINEWGGTKENPKYCLLSSQWYIEFNPYGSYQRLVKCYKHDNKPNTIVMDDMFYDGYDVLLTFDTSNPAKPLLKMEPNQVIGDEFMVFGQEHGDGRILATHSPRSGEESYYNACQKFAQMWMLFYVNDFSTLVGYIGYYYNILEWVSQEEAEEMMREGL